MWLVNLSKDHLKELIWTIEIQENIINNKNYTT